MILVFRNRQKKAAIQILTRTKGIKFTLCLSGWLFFHFVPCKNILFSQTLYLISVTTNCLLLWHQLRNSFACIDWPTIRTMRATPRLPFAFRFPSYSIKKILGCHVSSKRRLTMSRLSRQGNSEASFPCLFWFFGQNQIFFFFLLK